MERSRKNFLKKVILSLCCLCILGLGVVYGISDYMERHTVGRILSSGEAQKLDADCILVLGCRVLRMAAPALELQKNIQDSEALCWRTGWKRALSCMKAVHRRAC